MKAVQFSRFGDADVLEVVDRPVPDPGPGEVRVRVASAGLNPIDYKTRKGLGFAADAIRDCLPWVPGYDVAGTVDAVGDDVEQWLPGDAVLGLVGFPARAGTQAEFVIARADELVVAPGALPLNLAGAIPLAALTAWQALFDVAQLQPDQKVLVLAGAGGVGHFAVQFARWRGAHVIATASKANHGFLDSLGEHELIDYRSQSVTNAGYGVDVVLDLIGGDAGKDALRCVSSHGVMVSVPTVTVAALKASGEMQGVRVEGLVVRPDIDQLDEIVELIDAGEVKVEVSRSFALEDIQVAHRELEGGHVRGKLVVCPATS